MKKILITFILSILFVGTFGILNVGASEYETGSFTGRNGSPSGSALYEATNTFSYVANASYSSIHNYFDTSAPLNNASPIKSGAPQITVLTHGLIGDASHWCNDGNDNFAYDSSSIVSRINGELLKNGHDASIYWAVMQSNVEFKLYDLNNPVNFDNGRYIQTETTTVISSVAKHIIIIFQATEIASKGYNYEVYEEFNYMISKIVYDVKGLNDGYLPKINLIGHSRGGLTNLEYALDHPLMIESVFSLGTPYFGSDTAATPIGAALTNTATSGRADIISEAVYLNYYNRWTLNYNSLYSSINYHAIGGFSDSDFVFDTLIEDEHIVSLYVSDDLLLKIRNIVFHNPAFIKRLKSVPNKRELLMSILDESDISEDELDSYIEILTDIKYSAYDDNSGFWQNLWSNIIHNIPRIGCPFFMNDVLVDLSSQIGVDEHGNSGNNYGFKKYHKCFRNGDYENKDKKLSSYYMPAVVHNLEARDEDIINYILSNITLGYNDMFIYETLPDNTVRVVGYKGNIASSSITVEAPNYIVTEIGPHIFQNIGSNITSITIPNSVEVISEEAFIGLSNLEEVIFTSNSNLTYIGDRAFADCENLSKFGTVLGNLNIPSNVTYVGDFAFYGTDFSSITIDEDLNEIGVGAFANNESLQSISVDSNNSNYYSNSNVLFSFDNCLLQYPIAKNFTSYTVPSSIDFISPCAFMNSTLSIINLGSIEEIGNSAFEGCGNLTYISIPNTVTMIGSSAFKNCIYLDSVSLSSNLESIGTAAFEGCESLANLVIPSSVISIGGSAFKDCSSLDYVEINREQTPITSVGYGAFDNCHSSLQIEVPKNRIGDYKNKSGWKRYCTVVVPDSTTFTSYNVYENSNICFSDSVAAGYNKIYRLDVVDEYYYGIKATASYNTVVELYDSNMIFIDSNLVKISQILDSNTTYYISISFQNESNSGTISTQIKHFHDYDDLYVWKNLTEHKAYCHCGLYNLSPHIVSPDAFQGGLPRARCLLCNGFASIGEIYHEGIGGYPYTLNGSFILPNGVIVLADEDFDAYMNGTLVFIIPNENIDRGVKFIPGIIRREDNYWIDASK